MINTITNPENINKKAYINISDFTACCLEHMRNNGFDFSGPLIADGKHHHFNSGNHRRPGDWYFAFEGISDKGNPYLTCMYASFRNPEARFTFRSWENDGNISREDHASYIRASKEVNEKRIAEEKMLADQAAIEAQKIWDSADTTPKSDDYLIYCKNKKIEPLGVKFGLNPYGDPGIILRLEDINGNTRALQYIGKWKCNQENALKPGCFTRLGKLVDGNIILITEGYGAANSVHTATKQCTISVNGGGNMDAVVGQLVLKYPHSSIVIAADNDAPGQRVANAVASKYKCSVIYPVFPTYCNKTYGEAYSDFNDLEQACGREVVATQLAKAELKQPLAIVIKNIAENLLKEKDPCDCFSLSDLPNCFASYIGSICEQAERICPAHPLMITNAVLGMMSGYIGKRFFYSAARDEQLYCNIWCITIAESGSGKSLSLRLGTKLARENQSNIHARIRDLEAQLEKAPNSDKIDLERDILMESLQNVILPDKCSAEGFLEHLSQGHSGVILLSEIAPWLQNLEKNFNGDLKGLLTSFFDVTVSHVYKRTGSSKKTLIIQNPYISICSYSTASWVRRNIKPDDVESGFLARFLLYNILPKATDLELEECPTYAYNNDDEYLIKYLLSLLPVSRQYKFTEESWKFYVECKRDIAMIQKQFQDNNKELLAPFVARWKTYLIKISMLMQFFINPGTDKISVQAVQAAMALLLPAVNSTASLFEKELGESDFQHKCRKVYEFIIKRIRENKGIPIKGSQIRDSKVLDGAWNEYDYVLESLIDSDKIICEKPMKGGMPTNNKKDFIYSLPLH